MAYIGLSPVVGEFRKLDDISGQFNDTNTVFNLTVGGSAVQAGSSQNLIISIDGVVQEPQTAYIASGASIAFTEAPNTASAFFGILLGSVNQVGVISDDTVTSAKLQNNSVTENKLAANAVTTAKIGSAAVTEAKIGSAAVTEAKIGSAAVTETKIGSAAVTETKIGSAAVTTSKIASNVSIQFAVGSNTAPSISVDGDTNTGIFFPAADTIAFTRNGVEVGRFDSTANANFQFNSGFGSAGTAYGCRAWVNFDGTGTPAIRGSGNVSSITDNGTGDYTVNFTTAMPDANYGVASSNGFNNNAVSPGNTGRGIVINNLAVGSVRIGTPGASGDGGDPLHVFVSIFR